MMCVGTSRLKSGRLPGMGGLVPERNLISRSGPNAAGAAPGKDVALQRPRRRAERQATQSGFGSGQAIARFRPLNAGGAVAAQRPYLRREVCARGRGESKPPKPLAVAGFLGQVGFMAKKGSTHRLDSGEMQGVFQQGS